MIRVFRSGHGYLYRTTGNPKSGASISHLRIPAKIQYAASTVSCFDFNDLGRRQISLQSSDFGGPEKGGEESTVQRSHPWPEWLELMELLSNRGYFGVDENPFENGQLGSKDSNLVRTACLNFARDRHGLLRRLSRKDVRVIAGFGCPSMDRKVVNSGKRLRAHTGIEEGSVCGPCNLRGNCERAYMKAREDQGARTVDVMRLVLTYALDPVISTVNCQRENKVVKESVRKLLKEMVECSLKDTESNLLNATPHNEPTSGSQEDSSKEISTKQGDWHCSKCNFLNFARNIKCLRCDAFFEERLKQLREDQDHLPLKKGDWICEMCNFLNFAKNTRCLRCKEKPPTRVLNPGEWECESCNYINFRRNMVCLRCDHRRPKALNDSKPPGQPENRSVSCRHNGKSFYQFESETGCSKTRGPDMWSFVKEETEEEPNPDCRFLDFPIEGGKSIVSRSVEKREKWKLEMLEKGKSDGGRIIENKDDETRSTAYSQRRLELLGYTDNEDEGMDDWFAQK